MIIVTEKINADDIPDEVANSGTYLEYNPEVISAYNGVDFWFYGQSDGYKFFAAPGGFYRTNTPPGPDSFTPPPTM